MTVSVPHLKLKYEYYMLLVNGINDYLRDKIGEPPQSKDAETWLKKTCDEVFTESDKDTLIKLWIGSVDTLSLGVKKDRYTEKYFFVSGDRESSSCLIKFRFDTFYVNMSDINDFSTILYQTTYLSQRMYEDENRAMLNYIDAYMDWYETFINAKKAAESFIDKCEYIDDLPFDLQQMLWDSVKEGYFDDEKALKRFLNRILKQTFQENIK